MKRRIIVSFDDADVNACEALLLAKSAVSGGYISEAAGIKHFCWLTTFAHGLHVSVRRKASAASADSLHVWREAGKP